MYRYNETIKILINKVSRVRKNLCWKIFLMIMKDFHMYFYESVFVKYILDKVNSNDDDVLKEIFVLLKICLLMVMTRKQKI